ncbi:MAG: hypothetical protein JWQ88_1810 [Rhodoferax sp.]|nr:hypothetical protein [Rhodoferax sp.]
MKRGKKHKDARSASAKQVDQALPSAAVAPPDPERVNHGTEPGESFCERWTNKVYSTPDPSAERGRDTIDAGKHQEPTPFTRNQVSSG